LAVDQLHRVRIGALTLGPLKPGAWRTITPSEVIEPRASGRCYMVHN
ncbi:hypothetical protein HY523_02620, partial [Candidatus Berkelbacteria bacterium]|nr:hypothetical protein [Candidatus Berkelbacteria bacterium]